MVASPCKTMINKSDPSTPATLKQIATTFRITGWVSLWIQVVLTVVSGAILLFASTTNRGIGVVLTLCSIFGLFFNIYWALFRYVPIGRRLQDSAVARPKKADVVQALRIGLVASLVGSLLGLLGAEATVGLLFGKAANQGALGLVNPDPSKYIQATDVLVLQASINVILAQFAAISASLWLLNRMSRQ